MRRIAAAMVLIFIFCAGCSHRPFWWDGARMIPGERSGAGSGC